jgi:hypothetical protein
VIRRADGEVGVSVAVHVPRAVDRPSETVAGLLAVHRHVRPVGSVGPVERLVAVDDVGRASVPSGAVVRGRTDDYVGRPVAVHVARVGGVESGVVVRARADELSGRVAQTSLTGDVALDEIDGSGPRLVGSIAVRRTDQRLCRPVFVYVAGPRDRPACSVGTRLTE